MTAVFNAAGTIQETIDAVAAQTYPQREHIVIDGGSRDGTVEIIERNRDKLAYFVSEPDRGVYDAMNKGLERASGDVVACLNADDVYVSPRVLARVAEVMVDRDVAGCYANLYFVRQHDPAQIVRRMRSQPYCQGLFERGWMPPHPTLFIRRDLLTQVGGFDLAFRLQSDFDLAIRLFRLAGERIRYVDETWVRMRMGGLSNRSWRHVLRGNLEAYAACRKNGLNVWPWFPVQKVLSRIPEFLRKSGAGGGSALP
ncbi:glycosyltransferase family 2 protein [Candidatus Dactylopiibacterium carminicum]|uniref:glycosyltransferase family 2 protein n=1 Tax=Candidatus Dactylopiibacterium carminicum TaxID=857335 RepID=UPI001EF7B3AC|nr:glycosyltransferase family 2 protein [Candidatus Dactylopiibacterium carminicum]